MSCFVSQLAPAASERRFGGRGARIDGSRGRSGGGGPQISGSGGRIPWCRSSNQRRRRSNRRRRGRSGGGGAPIGGGVARIDSGSAADASTRATLPAQDSSPSAPLHVARPPLCSWLGRIGRPDTYLTAYPTFAKIIKNRILRGYVSGAYRTRIRIRYVSDT